ncbi:MAG TPA: hypothetical protein VF718_13785 [Allosphingosinicella sp.]|jgi:hypothetical protein
MANAFVDAANSIDGNAAGETAARFAGYCGTYGYVILIAAVLFLGAGLIFVILAGRFEAAKAKAEAEKAEAEAKKAKAEAEKAELEAEALRRGGAGDGGPDGPQASIIVGPVVTVAKGLAEALGNAKAWVAMVIIGLVLLWMAGSAPQTCVVGPGADETSANTGDTNDSIDSNTANTTTTNTTTNSSTTNSSTGGNGQAPAAGRPRPSEPAPPPELPAGQGAGGR